MSSNSVRTYYYSYPPYLQPTSSLSATSPRINGSASIGSRPKFGGINRIYNFAKAHNQVYAFYNQLIFAMYGIKSIN